MDFNFSQWVIDFIGVSTSLEISFIIVWFVIHFTWDFDEVCYKIIQRIKRRKALKKKVEEESKDE